MNFWMNKPAQAKKADADGRVLNGEFWHWIFWQNGNFKKSFSLLENTSMIKCQMACHLSVTCESRHRVLVNIDFWHLSRWQKKFFQQWKTLFKTVKQTQWEWFLKGRCNPIEISNVPSQCSHFWRRSFNSCSNSQSTQGNDEEISRMNFWTHFGKRSFPFLPWEHVARCGGSASRVNLMRHFIKSAGNVNEWAASLLKQRHSIFWWRGEWGDFENGVDSS